MRAMRKTSLFIGGTRDGARIEFDKALPEVLLVDKRSRPIVAVCDPTEAAIDWPIKTVSYRRIDMHGQRDKFHVYAESGMTIDDVLSALISRYPEERSEGGTK